MKKIVTIDLGFNSQAVVITISLITILMVGAAWYYQTQQPATETEAVNSERASCEARGGRLVRGSSEYGTRCVVPYADAGTPCTSSDQCEGDCVTTNLDQLGVAGTCAADNNIQGCATPVEKEFIECLFDDIMVRCTADSWTGWCLEYAERSTPAPESADARCYDWLAQHVMSLCEIEIQPGYYFHPDSGECRTFDQADQTGCSNPPFASQEECQAACIISNI